MVDLKTLNHQSLVDPKPKQLKSVSNNQRKRSPEKISPVFSELIQLVGWKFGGIEETLGASTAFRSTQLDQIVVKRNILGWSEMRKDIESKWNTCMICNSSGGTLKYQLPSN